VEIQTPESVQFFIWTNICVRVHCSACPIAPSMVSGNFYGFKYQTCHSINK